MKDKFDWSQENYESVRDIGERKFAQIYCAKCIKDGSIVVLGRLKLTENAFINNHKFKKEAKIFSTIFNPNVVGVLLQLK